MRYGPKTALERLPFFTSLFVFDNNIIIIYDIIMNNV